MAERWELVELIGQTLEERNIAASEQTVEAVLDSVEGQIRADERERTNTVGGHRQIRDEGRADMCADLRAKVEALPVHATLVYDDAWVKRDDVLALFDGRSDE